jgi:hypothetical protein
VIFVLFQTCHIFVSSSILLPYSGFHFFNSSWDECPTNLWTLPTFSNCENITREDLTHPVAAAATSQVKLCPYDEEEPHIWFRLIGKSKWQSYFELLRLPMEMQGLKPSVLMGKLKQHLPPGVSPDNDLFLAMFLIRLPPLMRETVGTGAVKTAAAMVKAADALWDARGSHDPMVAAALTQRAEVPLPAAGREATKGAVTPVPKVAPPSCPDFHSFQNPGNGMCKFHNYYAIRANKCIPPCSWSEN